MDKELLKETEIGENMTVNTVLRDDHVEFVVTTYEVSTSYLLNFEEWEEFVKCVNVANLGYKVETKKQSD